MTDVKIKGGTMCPKCGGTQRILEQVDISALRYFRCIYCGYYEFIDENGDSVYNQAVKPLDTSIPMPGKVTIPPRELKEQIIEARKERGGIKRLGDALGVTPEAIYYHIRKLGV